ncbi:MAG: pyridoxal phosphate-dependent aminotransferase, partial [Chloroflexota bacterium]
MSEYPPADYRELVEAASARYGVGRDEILVGAGADEILDLCAKALLAPGDAAVIPVPTYAMFRVATEQRAARAVLVPRLGPEEDWALDTTAIRDAARDASLVWLCSPNNPTGLEEREGVIEQLLRDLEEDARRDDRPTPAVVLDEAYAEFVDRSRVGLRLRHPNLVVVRTASKAYALAGLRVGFAIAAPETIGRIAPYRPPGSVSTVSVTVVTEALRDERPMRANVEAIGRERPRLAAALEAAGWRVGPSVANFLLVDFGTRERAAAVAQALLARGLVPRTFGPAHPNAAYLRVTVRTPTDDDRLIEAAQEIERGVSQHTDPAAAEVLA